MNVMKKIVIVCLLLGMALLSAGKGKSVKRSDYVIVANESVLKDAGWKQVVDALLAKHGDAVVCTYTESPRETMNVLRENMPRYVAVVEKPENIGKDYIYDMNRMSREVDDDIYADFMYGIITGYDAEAALRMVNDSREPMVISSALATIKELKSGKWFDTFAYVSDETLGVCGEKEAGADSVTEGLVPHIDVMFSGTPSKAWSLLEGFTNFYKKYDPDLIVTASHATENNLEVPFSAGNIKAKDGQLYADNPVPTFLSTPEHPRVYLPIGNCLIGNVNNTKNSMAIAWMNSGRASALIGYVVPTWYGRAGWGGLKYWLTTPGRYTLSEAFFLNQQDMLYQINTWGAGLEKKAYQNNPNAQKDMADVLKGQPTQDQVGFFHDRDVLAIYGDPAWDVRLKELPEETDFTVTSVTKGKKCIITVVTKADFSMERMAGSHFKEEHVKDLPFSYFFPQKLKNPRLAKGQAWKVATDENFLLVYEPDFKPDQTYQIVLDVDR